MPRSAAEEYCGQASGVVDRVEEGLKRNKIGDRDTNEILQSHCPPLSPSRNALFPASLDFFSRRDVPSFTRPVSLARPLVDRQ